MLHPSLSKCSQRYGIATVSMSSLQNALLNASKSNVLKSIKQLNYIVFYLPLWQCKIWINKFRRFWNIFFFFFFKSSCLLLFFSWLFLLLILFLLLLLRWLFIFFLFLGKKFIVFLNYKDID